MNKNIISIKNLHKEYFANNIKQIVLNKIDFKMFEGDIVSISGPSGSGKSTFLNILGFLDSDFKGDYFFLDDNTKNISLADKNKIRNKSLGFVHQFFYLIPELSVLENVVLPKLILENKYTESIKIAKEILYNFGLENKMNSKPLNLSGGEQQRVSIARALINKPKLLIADEMTGNLDEKTADNIFNFFLNQVRENNQSLIFVTHNKNYAKKAKYEYTISQHKLVSV